MQKKRLIIDLSLMTVVCAMIFLTGCAKNEQKQEQVQEQSKAQVQNIEKSGQENVAQQSEVAGNKKDNGGERPAMPEEAITACTDKEVDDTCTMETTDSEDSTKKMTGTCQSTPGDTETLACMPEHGQGGGPQNGQGPRTAK